MEQTLQYLQQNWLEIFSLVTGLIFLILEIRQKNAMWVVCIFSSSVAAIVFLNEKLYASMALNVYYVITAIWGLFTWIRDSRKLRTESVAEASNKDKIHLSKLTWKIFLISIVCFLILTPVIYKILIYLGDSSSILDAIVLVMSIIATVWLVKSYPQQWLVWIVADLLSTTLCLTQGMYWMAALYAFYTLSAVYGFIHWKKRGVYV
ncbi:MAG: nicotinamide mononucleotide transporter [Bacteroidales bacterium]|nr:nicotinamide mononucleotide transporter [Bacteroidales bacterium]